MPWEMNIITYIKNTVTRLTCTPILHMQGDTHTYTYIMLIYTCTYHTQEDTGVKNKH